MRLKFGLLKVTDNDERGKSLYLSSHECFKFRFSQSDERGIKQVLKVKFGKSFSDHTSKITEQSLVNS